MFRNQKGFALPNVLIALFVTGLVAKFSTKLITDSNKNQIGLEKRMEAYNLQRNLYSILGVSNACLELLKDPSGNPAKYRMHDPGTGLELHSTIDSIEKVDANGNTTLFYAPGERYGKVEITDINLPNPTVANPDNGEADTTTYTVPLTVKVDIRNPGVGAKTKNLKVVMTLKTNDLTGDIVSCNTSNNSGGGNYDPEEACNNNNSSQWIDGACVEISRVYQKNISSAQPLEIFLYSGSP